jgi:YHS domain-containing protein
MPTEADMKDTAVYKNKTYGFCSALCKDEFKKILKSMSKNKKPTIQKVK